MNTSQPITANAYQWFPKMGEAPHITLGANVGLKAPFDGLFYCRTTWGLTRILPASWVVDHPEYGILCMDPEIFDAVADLAAVAASPD